MNKALKRIDIDIPNNWLNSGYYVYIAKIGFEGKTYFYIGQTGDNHHPTARGPLYRISGHISKLGSSAQNQIIKGLRKELEIQTNEHERLEQVLSKIHFSYRFWKINDFDYSDSQNIKKRKRKETQLIEHYLIYTLQEKNNLFNKRVKTQVASSNKNYFSDSSVKELKNISIQILNEH